LNLLSFSFLENEVKNNEGAEKLYQQGDTNQQQDPGKSSVSPLRLSSFMNLNMAKQLPIKDFVSQLKSISLQTGREMNWQKKAILKCLSRLPAGYAGLSDKP
jgi:hypothetical protein